MPKMFATYADSIVHILTGLLGQILYDKNWVTNSYSAALLYLLQLASPSFIPMKTTELLNKISGRGLHVLSRFTRSPHLFSPAMVSIELTFTNLSSEELMDIRISQKVGTFYFFI